MSKFLVLIAVDKRHLRFIQLMNLWRLISRWRWWAAYHEAGTESILRAYPNNLRSATLDHSRYDWGMKIITCKTKRTRTRSPNNKTTTGYRISDDLWAVLQPLLPVHLNPHPLGGGRPRIPDR